jgi:hypothetical protein
MSNPKFDVAISFLVKNEAIARELNTKLEGPLTTFFFPRKQEELVGTDGLESMREPFMEARVAVVIFDEPWGETPWTRVEASAIKDRCLAKGWDGLVFVQVNKKVPLPKWLPNTHVRFSLEDFPLEQLAGAIKMRVQEHGGAIKKLDAVARAKQVRSEQEYLADREALVRDFNWIHNVVHASVRANVQEVVRLVDELNKDGGFSIQAGAHDRQVVMRQGWVSVGCGWTQPIANLVIDDPNYRECHFRVAEFSGHVMIPGEQGMYMERPTLLKQHRFKVEVSQTRDLMWKEKGKSELIAADKLADRAVQIFLDVVSRMNKGKIARPGY